MPFVNRSPADIQIQPTSQAIDLKLEFVDVCNDSLQKAYDWIRNKDEDAEILRGDLVVKAFPNGPHDRLSHEVDIVVVTPKGTYLQANQNCFS